MNSRLFAAVLATACALIGMQQPLTARDRTLVLVASCAGEPKVVAPQVQKVTAALKEQKFHCFSGNELLDEKAKARWDASLGPNVELIFVPRDISGEARRFLALAAQKGTLSVTLRAEDGTTIAPEKILEPIKKP